MHALKFPKLKNCIVLSTNIYTSQVCSYTSATELNSNRFEPLVECIFGLLARRDHTKLQHLFNLFCVLIFKLVVKNIVDEIETRMNLIIINFLHPHYLI